MENCNATLLIIYEIVKSDPAPQTYLCTPHEIILRHTLDWTLVEKHLEALAAEKLVVVKKLDKMFVSITSGGIVKAKAIKNNFISTNFSLPDLNEGLFKLNLTN